MIQGKNILIVDDDSNNVFAISAVLRQMHPNLFVAVNGLECLKRVKENPPIDLILLDLMMPEFDGYKTLEILQEDEATRHIPVIIVTARIVPKEKEKLLSSGARAYIEKPVVFETLLYSIRQICM